jgi:hypothetical protein
MWYATCGLIYTLKSEVSQICNALHTLILRMPSSVPVQVTNMFMLSPITSKPDDTLHVFYFLRVCNKNTDKYCYNCRLFPSSYHSQHGPVHIHSCESL